MWLCPNNLNATPTIDKERGLIYTIALDGKFYGLDLGTGKTRTGPVQIVPPYAKDWSLNLFNGIVYTSISQGCGGARSGVYSIDIRHPNQAGHSRRFGLKRRSGHLGPRWRLPLATTVLDLCFDRRWKFRSREWRIRKHVAQLPPPRALDILDYYSPRNFEQITKYDAHGYCICQRGLDSLSQSSSYRRWRQRRRHLFRLTPIRWVPEQDHQTARSTARELANDQLGFESLGIWGEMSTWRDVDGNTWLYIPIWGPVSKEAPQFPVTYGPNPHGSLMAFKVETDSGTHKPTLTPTWISGDFDVPEPVAIANGVIFALSTGENTAQVTGTSVVIAKGYTLLTEASSRGENTHNAVLRALDAKTGKVLYQSGDTIGTWVHFSGLAVADGRVFAVDHNSVLYCFGVSKQ